jgi:hypothetical protein
VKFSWRWQAAAVVIVAICGCGNNRPQEKLVSVSGTVTVDGKPLEGATVAFVPEKSKQPQPSWGFSDASGKYSLKTVEGEAGVALGTYRIVITKLVMEDGSPIPPGSQTGGADGKELVPFPHCDPRQTKNVANVTKDGEVFDIAIKSEEPDAKGKKKK